jgi:hypothetical protein
MLLPGPGKKKLTVFIIQGNIIYYWRQYEETHKAYSSDEISVGASSGDISINGLEADLNVQISLGNGIRTDSENNGLTE